MKSPRVLAAMTLLVSTFAIAPRMASAGCTTNCSTERSQIEICTTCCRICVTSGGVVTYDNCDTRCVWM